MAEIDIELCGQSTTIACAPEDAARVRHLVQVIDAYVEQARTIVGDSDRWRQLLFAAIFMAEQIESNNEPSSDARPSSGTSDAFDRRVATLANRFSALVDRLESLDALEPQVRNA